MQPFVMPDKIYPINDLEQKMVELNVLLYENFENVSDVSETIGKIFDAIPEDSGDKDKFLNILCHFRCLEQLVSGNPSFMEIIKERNSYKDGTLP